MTRSFLVEGFILRKRDFDETGRLFSVYTREIGKITVLAKGVRKINSKYGGILENLNQVRLSLYHGKNFYLLQEAQLIFNIQTFWQNWPRTLSGFQVMETVDRILEEEKVVGGLFELLEETTRHFITFKKTDWLATVFYFNLLKLLGGISSFNHCSKCGQKFSGERGFLTSRLSLLCQTCLDPTKQILETVEGKLIQILNFLEEEPLARQLSLRVSQKEIQAINSLVDLYQRSAFDKRLKTIDFLCRDNKPFKIGAHGRTSHQGELISDVLRENLYL
ncbi:DNA repair protein RecO [Candidatus Peregrinibacteria bacterium CG1_02_41_10]|nr:MAG: DNA repair protein RecO [Candidatus Peregrinibacteria bacterium CG1_02_41_10]